MRKTQVTIGQDGTWQVGAAEWDLVKEELGYHRRVRSEAESFGLRDAYLTGRRGYGLAAAHAHARRRAGG